MDMNVAYDTILTDLENKTFDTDVDYIVENNGIGAYEYWGAKGYDEGVDTLLIEEPSIVSIKLPWANRLLNKIGNDIIFEDDTILGQIIYRDEPFKITGKIDTFTVKTNEIVFTIVWDEEQEG